MVKDEMARQVVLGLIDELVPCYQDNNRSLDLVVQYQVVLGLRNELVPCCQDNNSCIDPTVQDN
jgi:hypothetical protein